MKKMTGDYVLTAQELSLIGGGTNVGKCIAYTVVKGDSLGQIARRYGVDSHTLSELNSIAPGNKIFVGQVLLIPFSAQ